MTNNTIYLAAAGAGKTTFIIRQAMNLHQNGLTEGKKILIVTYTDNNQNNIREMFIKEYGYHPKEIVILGWFTFLLDYWIRPFKGTVIEQLYEQHVGMLFVEGISGKVELSNQQIFTSYSKTNLIGKFLDKSRTRIYSDKLAEFAHKCWEQNENDLIERMSNIADTIFIDEAQDLAAWDYELIKILIKSDKINCFLCGDPRQSTYKTTESPKYSKYSGDIASFAENEINQKRRKYVNIDTSTLSKSHRCDAAICDFSSSIIPTFPPTEMCSCLECTKRRDSYTLPKGIFLVKEQDLQKFIDIYNPLSLRWDKKVKLKAQTEYILNWGESKGLQADATLVYMTKTLLDWYKPATKPKKPVSRETLRKFYVAVTRARYVVGLVVPNNFDNTYINIPFFE